MKRILNAMIMLMAFSTCSLAQVQPQLRAADCSRQNLSLTQSLFANISVGTQFRFKVRNVQTNVTDSVTNSVRSFNLSQIPSVARYDCNYEVQVKIDAGGGFSAYGPICNVKTDPLITQIRSTDCDKVLLQLFSGVFANQTTADSWDFEVRFFDDPTVSQIVLNRPTREFKLSMVSNNFWVYSTRFEIRCRTTQGGILQPWGPWCSFYTPSVTPPVITSGCGQTFEYLAYEYITCTFQENANQYRWRLRQGTTTIGTVITTTNQVRIGDFMHPTTFAALYDYGRTYSIQAQSYNGVAWTAYGTGCTVRTTTTPHTEVQHLCNATLASFSQPISVFAIFGADEYIFEVTDVTPSSNNSGTQTITKTYPTRTVALSELPLRAYGHQYSVRCRVRFKGVLYPFSTACFVNSPPAITKLRPVDCPKTLTSASAKVWTNTMTADSPLSVTGYQFRIGSQESAWKATRDVTLAEILGAAPAGNTTYQVQVRLTYAGVVQPYGEACAVTTPSSIVLNPNPVEESNDFERDAGLFNVFPNPTGKDFTIRLADEIAQEEVDPFVLMVKNSSGKLVLNESINAAQEVVFGSDLGSGFYFLECYKDGILVERKKLFKFNP